MLLLNTILILIYLSLIAVFIHTSLKFSRYLQQLGEKYNFHPLSTQLQYNREFKKTLTNDELKEFKRLRKRAWLSIPLILLVALVSTLLLRFVFSFFIEIS